MKKQNKIKENYSLTEKVTDVVFFFTMFSLVYISVTLEEYVDDMLQKKRGNGYEK